MTMVCLVLGGLLLAKSNNPPGQRLVSLHHNGDQQYCYLSKGSAVQMEPSLDVQNYSGDGVSGTYFWGWAIGKLALSLVPTFPQRRLRPTRSADDVSSDNTIPQYSTEMTFWMSFREFAFSASNGVWLSDGISAQIYDHTSSGNYRAFANAVADANIRRWNYVIKQNSS